jgi:hypothetical protein
MGDPIMPRIVDANLYAPQHLAMGRCMLCGEEFHPANGAGTIKRPLVGSRPDASAPRVARAEVTEAARAHACEGAVETFTCESLHQRAGIDLTALVADTVGRPPRCMYTGTAIGGIRASNPETRWRMARDGLLDAHWAAGCWRLQTYAGRDDSESSLTTQVVCECGMKSGKVTHGRGVMLGWLHAGQCEGGPVEVIACAVCEMTEVRVRSPRSIPLTLCECVGGVGVLSSRTDRWYRRV